MSDPIEELPVAPIAPKGGGGSPWLPVLAILILMPLLSLAMWQFVIKSQLDKMIKAQAAAAQGGEPAEDDHAPANPDDAHGKKGDGGHGKEGPGEGGQSIEFPGMITNLAGTLQSRYLRVSLLIIPKDKTSENLMNKSQEKARLKDVVLTVLGNLTLQDVEQPGIKNKVRSELINGMDNALGKKCVNQIYFTEWVIQ